MLTDEQLKELEQATNSIYYRSTIKVISGEDLVKKVIMTRNINLQDKNGNTLLMCSILMETKEIIKTLIKLGANPTIKNCSCQTALDWAKNKEEILEALNINESKAKALAEIKNRLQLLLK